MVEGREGRTGGQVLRAGSPRAARVGRPAAKGPRVIGRQEIDRKATANPVIVFQAVPQVAKR